MSICRGEYFKGFCPVFNVHAWFDMGLSICELNYFWHDEPDICPHAPILKAVRDKPKLRLIIDQGGDSADH